MEPIARTEIAANDSALLMVLIAVVVVNMLLTPSLVRSARVFFKQLFRTHREATPGEKTFGERLVIIIGVLQTLIFEALLLYCLTGADEMPPLASMAGLLLLTGLLFGVQYCGYSLTGFAFTSGENTHQWLSSFLLTQACGGFPMVIAAMGALFYPRSLQIFLLLGFIIFIIIRIPLYIREFGIFYSSPTSTFYFFLYLCTLEIVPFIGVLAFANFFSSLFC